MSNDDSGSESESESGFCDPFTIDLRSFPQRDDVGMEAGEKTVSHTCDDGVEVTIELPDETLTLDLRRIGADSMLAGDPETAAPNTIDLHTMWATVDGAADTAERIGDVFGIDTAEALSKWRQEATSDTAAPGMQGLDVRTLWLRGAAGVASVEMRVTKQSISDHSSVHLVIHLADDDAG